MSYLAGRVIGQMVWTRRDAEMRWYGLWFGFGIVHAAEEFKWMLAADLYRCIGVGGQGQATRHHDFSSFDWIALPLLCHYSAIFFV